jgi:4-amino-4-deoxy-L-arabinose transferase-like glycosyltransferase
VGALVLLATPHYLELSKVGMLDVPLTFFVTLAVLSYGRGLERPGWLAVAGAAFGLAFLTKGVAALVAPLACALHLLVSRRFDLLRSGWLWLGGLAAVAIAAPWHLHQWRLHGDAFLDEYLGYHVLRRGREAIEGHEGSPLFFVETLFEHQLPWVLLLPIAIPAAVLAVVKRGRRELLLPLLWGATILGLYSAAATKISWYILPAYPALALCIADWLVRKVSPHRFRSLLVGILAVLALVGATESRVFDLDYEPDVKALAIEARDLLTPESILFVHQTDTPTVLFYAERPVRALDGARLEALREELRRSGFALGVVRGEDQVDMVLGILDEADAVVVGQRGEDWLVRWSPRAADR